MSATEDWLRYIESKVIEQKYNITGYSNDGDTTSEQLWTNSEDKNV